MVPVLVLPKQVDAFSLPKLMLAEVLGLLSLLFVAYGFWRGELSAPDKGVRRLIVSTALLGAWVTLGVALSSHSEHAWASWADFGIGLLCLWGWTLGLSSKELRSLINLIVWPAMAVSVGSAAAVLRDLSAVQLLCRRRYGSTADHLSGRSYE